MKFFGIRLLTDDFKKSVAFYKDVLEFPVKWHLEDMEYALFTMGETGLEIFSRQAMADAIGDRNLYPEGNHPPSVVLDFGVDNVDAAYRHLSSRGIEFINPPHDRQEWGARVAHFRDPDGNLIEIYTSLNPGKEE